MGHHPRPWGCRGGKVLRVGRQEPVGASLSDTYDLAAFLKIRDVDTISGYKVRVGTEPHWMLLMGVHHFFWFVWEGVVVELPVR